MMMKNPEPLKRRLRRGEPCKGTFALFSAGGDFPLFLAGLGFDFFIFDLEHSAFDLARTRETLLGARAAGIAAIVRVPEIAYHFVARVLDAGASGIMLPRVETRDQAEQLVRFCRYPPLGERGISTFAGHNDFTRIPDVPRFLQEKNDEILVVVQIETVTGVERCDTIVSVPGVDACFVGTGDLAMSMGFAGQPQHPEVLAQTQKVLATARAHDRIVSLPIRAPEDVARWVGDGMRMLTLGTDGLMFSSGAGLYLNEVNRCTSP